jgi:hypothetical protein
MYHFLHLGYHGKEKRRKNGKKEEEKNEKKD